jgi:DNA mismatch repair protein MutL
MQEELFTLGFRLEPFGPTTLALHGVPPMVQESEAQAVLEQVLDAYRQSQQDPRLTKNVVLARTMARNLALKPGKRLSTEEMERLLADLFQCEMPYQSPSGKPVLVTLSGADLEKLFRKTLS